MTREHSEDKYNRAVQHFELALHLGYGHADQDAMGEQLGKLNEITGDHFNEREVCNFRILHNIAVQALEDSWGNGPWNLYEEPTPCGIFGETGECDLDLDDVREMLQEYLKDISVYGSWAAQENAPVLVVDRNYIISALQERQDFEQMDFDRLDQIEAGLSQKMAARGVYEAVNATIADVANQLSGIEIKTFKDWEEAGFVMRWSIFGEHPDDFEYEDWPLDFSAPEGVPDGAYQVQITTRHGTGTSGKIADSYAQIVNGKFDPYHTERACLEAVTASYGMLPAQVLSKGRGLDHIFIERFRFDEETGMLIVSVGS